MSSHGQASAIEPVLPDPLYMDRDINLRALAIFFFLVIFTVVASFVTMWWLLKSYDSSAKEAAAATATAVNVERQIPDASKGPLLQAWPMVEIRNFKEEQAMKLNRGVEANGKFSIGMPEAMSQAVSDGFLFKTAEPIK